MRNMNFCKQDSQPHFLIRVFLYSSCGNTLQSHLMELVGTHISEMYFQINLVGTGSKIEKSRCKGDIGMWVT